MKEIVKTSRLAGQLEKLFRMLNNDWFNGELETPIISLQPSTRAFGHYTLFDAWDVKEEGRKEINISTAYLDRPIEEVVATLLHEMVHMYNDTVLHVPDCSGSSHAYHNAKFRDAAVDHGLTCERTEKYGWCKTGPSEELLDWILENDVPEIRLNRSEPGGIRIAGGASAANGGAGSTSAAVKKGHSLKHRCPKCGLIARTTKAARLVCGDCMIHMVVED